MDVRYRSMSGAALESEATFSARVEELRIGEHLKKMQSLGWTSMAAFAYCTDYVPGVCNPDLFADGSCAPLG